MALENRMGRANKKPTSLKPKGQKAKGLRMGEERGFKKVV